MSLTRNEQNTQIPELGIVGSNAYQNIVSIRKKLSTEGSLPIDQVVNSGVLPYLIQLGKGTKINYEIAWIFINIASGKESHCSYLLEIGAVEYLESLFSYKNNEIRLQVMWAYGNLLSEKNLSKTVFRKINCERILKHIKNSKPTFEAKKTLSFFLSSVVYSGFCKKEILPLEVEFLKSLSIDSVDLDSLQGVAYSSSPTLISQYIDEDLVRILLKACESEDNCVYSLRVMVDISCSKKGSKLLLSKGFLELLPSFLNQSKQLIVTRSSSVLLNLLSNSSEIFEELNQKGTLSLLVEKLKHEDKLVREQALLTLCKCLVSGSKATLARSRVVSRISECLNKPFTNTLKDSIIAALGKFVFKFDFSVFPDECHRVCREFEEFLKHSKRPLLKLRNILQRLKSKADQEDDSI